MHIVQKLWFRKCFSEKFAEAKYTAFQDLFSEIMELRYGSDFSKICPWGAAGDLKCDGFLNPGRTIFQVYAPRELELANTIKKVDADFNGAKKNWQGLFSRWVFVHNDREGLPAKIKQHLDKLQKSNKKISIDHWGYQQLAQRVNELTFDSATAIFGIAPQPSEFIFIGYQDIEPLLVHLSNKPVAAAQEVLPVPAGKLSHNGLSQTAQEFLRLGMHQQNVVSRYFADVSDPEFGERVATAFRSKYDELKKEGLGPDDIFEELQMFTGGSELGGLAKQLAVLAVLAYFFDRCDIFERPEETAA